MSERSANRETALMLPCILIQVVVQSLDHPLTTARCFLRSIRPHDSVGVVGVSS